MAANHEDLQELVFIVADANSAIDYVVKSKALTPAAAQQLLLLLEECLHQVFPFAFEE